jgi:hypothetical protein
MTALAAYDLLEAIGHYVERDGAPKVEVLLKFGDASLTIMRFDDETPLAHWPLATLRFTAEEAGALVLAPDAAAPERLRVTDRDMVAALRAVCLEPVAPPPARPERRRWPAALALSLLLGLAAVLLWRPPAVMDRIAAFAPPEARAALGEAAVALHAGALICAPDAAARQALAAFAARLAPGGLDEGPLAIRLAALPPDAPRAAPAPGGLVLATRRAVEAGPEAFAEAVAIAAAQAERRPPTAEALRAAGVRGVLGALSGDLGYGGLATAAAARLAEPDVTSDDAVRAALMLEAAGLGVGASPFPETGWRALRRACGP